MIDLDAVLDEIVPALDPLRVPLSHHEDDDRVGDHALVLAGIPVGGDDSRLDEARHVRLEREGDDVGLEAGLDGAALLAGARVRLVELDPLARAGLVEVDQLGVRLARRRVGDEANGAAGFALRRRVVGRRAAATGESKARDDK